MAGTPTSKNITARTMNSLGATIMRKFRVSGSAVPGFEFPSSSTGDYYIVGRREKEREGLFFWFMGESRIRRA